MRTFNELRKNLKKNNDGLKMIKLAIVADSASQLLHQAIKGYGVEVGLNYDIYEADYDQVEMQVFDQSSELYQYQADFILLNFSAEHLLKSFYKCSSLEKNEFAESRLAYFDSIISTISASGNSRILLHTFIEINDSVFGNFAGKVPTSFIYQVRKLNLGLMDLARQHKNVFLYDLAMLQSQVGYQLAFDPKMYINVDLVYSLDFLPHVAKSVTDVILSITGTFNKCLVLDLDNTTWGGIIGDDGMEGIQLGSLGIGKAFTELQLWAKQLKERGIILAVCSKNTGEIAREPFEKHPDMVLRMEDIAVFNANWETKVDNIRHIQAVVNIGFDSMVFLDDNPFEREIVRTGIPALTVPELPEDPAEYLPYLRSLNLFETASFTSEDSERTLQYQQEAKRNILQKSFTNEAEFLQSLDMQATVASFNNFTIPRVAQLTQRSNQFNLRTVRYSEQEVTNLSRSANHFTLSLSLEDKFGDHGLISCIILERVDESTLFIDTWIMSCRVLKRGMEDFTLNSIVSLAKENGITKIVGEYLATRKNGIVKDHYLQLGFMPAGDKWQLDVNSFENRPNFISRKTEAPAGLEVV